MSPCVIIATNDYSCNGGHINSLYYDPQWSLLPDFTVKSSGSIF